MRDATSLGMFIQGLSEVNLPPRIRPLLGSTQTPLDRAPFHQPAQPSNAQAPLADATSARCMARARGSLQAQSGPVGPRSTPLSTLKFNQNIG
jgi:hypothetical protein